MADDTKETGGDDESEPSEQSGSGLRTLLLVGVSFAAGYVFGKSRGSEPTLREELDELGQTEEGPMEIEIQGTEGSSDADEEDETDDEEAEADEAEAEDGGE